MSFNWRWLLRLSGIGIIGIAALGNIPGIWAVLIGGVGVLLFLAAGPT